MTRFYQTLQVYCFQQVQGTAGEINTVLQLAVVQFLMEIETKITHEKRNVFFMFFCKQPEEKEKWEKDTGKNPHKVV